VATSLLDGCEVQVRALSLPYAGAPEPPGGNYSSSAGTILRYRRSVWMQKADDFRKHAQECRATAKRARSPGDRGMLLNMAQTWEDLAASRVRQFSQRERMRGTAAALIPSIV
jgi:hypothetical protein